MTMTELFGRRFVKFNQTLLMLFVMITTYSVMFTAYQTLRTFQPPPVVMSHHAAYAIIEDKHIVVEYRQTYTSDIDFTAQVSRVITCSNGWSYDDTAVTRHFRSGETNVIRSFQIPRGASAGDTCNVDVFMVWRPEFSLKDHVFHAKPVKFTVREK